MIVGVVGLGKLGLPFALTFARAGVPVLAYDHDGDVRDAVASRKSHIHEPGVQDMLDTYTIDLVSPSEMVPRAHVIFVIVPTPSLPNGEFDDSAIRAVITELPDVTKNYEHDGDRPIIAVVSTVSPGAFTTQDSFKLLAESRGYRVVYAPTLIALGSVVRNLTNPDVQIVGGDIESANVVRYTLYEITSGPFIKMDLESAAIAKLAINVFVTMKISFANALAHLCDAYKGDVDKVLLAVGYDTRIGRKSLTAGAGFGGPCFPRDTHAFAAAGGALGDAVIDMNDDHLSYVIRRIIQRDSSAIGVAGVSFMVLGREYKEDTTYRIESFGDRIAAMLTNYGGHETDDWAIADVVVIAQPLRSSKFNEHVTSGTFVYDLWRTHDYLAKRTDITYVQLGRPST